MKEIINKSHDVANKLIELWNKDITKIKDKAEEQSKAIKGILGQQPHADEEQADSNERDRSKKTPAQSSPPEIKATRKSTKNKLG